MGRVQNDVQNSRLVSKNVQEESGISGDDINLIDYFRVFSKRKYFILLGSVLPALMVGLVIFFWPRSNKMTYIYDIGLDEKEYKILPDKFYSAENLDRLISQLKKGGMNDYAQRIAGALTDKALKKLVSFEVSRSHFENPSFSETMEIQELRELQKIRNTLLAMTITGRPKKDMQKISMIIRDNFEKVIPIYSIKQELSSFIIDLKSNMASIEENRFSLELELERKKAILAKLKNLEPANSDRTPSGVTLQFGNIGKNSEYLPLAYQIQVTDANIVNIEETIRANQEKNNYHKSLLNLNERLLNEIKTKASLYYTVQEFHSFLTNIIGDYEDKELMDYLNAYIMRTENMISTNIPIIEKPKIYPVPKGTVKKTTIVFAICLMVTTFVAFLLEGIQKSEVRVS